MTAKDRPILFSAPMVRAILAGEKTVTRRAVKPQPPAGCLYEMNGAGTHALCRGDDGREAHAGSRWVPPTPKSTDHRLPCPHTGSLWVREAWNGWFGPKGGDLGDWRDWHETPRAGRSNENNRSLIYRATQEHPDVGRWVTPLFMPRWASRLTLEVVSVGCERLQAITDAGAVAEGARFRDVGSYHDGAKRPGWSMKRPHPVDAGEPDDCLGSARFAFGSLWNEIHGDGAWDANPYVWVVEFRRVEA